MAASKNPPGGGGRHLGLRLDDETAAKLDDLVADEQKKAGHYASVSLSSLVVGLIHAEHERRFAVATGGPKKSSGR